MPDKAKRHRITKLVLDEISLVDVPANPGAHVLIAKRMPPKAPRSGDGQDDNPLSFNEAVQANAARRKIGEAMSALWDAFEALRTSVESIATSDLADKQAAIGETLEQFQAAVGKIAPDLATIKKAADELTTGAGSDAITDETLEDFDMTFEELSKKLEEAEAAIAKAAADLKKANERADAAEADMKKAKGDGGQEEDVFKGMSPAARARFEAIEKSNRDMAEQLAKAAEKDATEQAIAKARTWDKLPGVAPAEFGPVLRRITKAAAAEDVTALHKVLDAANEALKTSAVFKEIGSGGSPSPAEDSAEGEVNKRAEAMQTADPKLSKAGAVAKVIEADPALYARYSAEQRKRARAA